MRRAIDLTGQRYGRLTVKARAGSDGTRRNPTWECLCECGATTIVSGNSLRTGHTKSCGCYRREHAARQFSREALTYMGAHSRVARVRGRASLHSCADCGESAFEWTYTYRDPNALVDERGRVFSLDPAYYEPRCRSCHRQFDAIESSSAAPAA